MLHFLRKHRSLVFLFVLLSASLTLNVVLGLKLVGRLERPVGLQERTYLNAIPVVDLHGADLTVAFEDQLSTVLYVLAPRCPWCARNRANIDALVAARRGEYRFIGLSNTDAGIREYIASDAMPMPIYVLKATALHASPALLRQFDPTPQTIVVAPGGTVQKVWVGAFAGQTQVDVERFFDVRLPGLDELPRVTSGNTLKRPQEK